MQLSLLGHASRVAGAVACLLTAACGDAAAPPPAPDHLRVVNGDGQTGPGGARLVSPLVFAVTDGAERPVPGVAITFAVVSGGGSVAAPGAVTGPDGAAVTEWVLGPTPVPQILEARADGISPVRATAAVADCAPAACPAADPPVLDVLELLALETYDRSGQVVHPDVAASTTVGAYPFWLAITPYPGGDPHFENPSLFESANGRLWQVPAGLTNPAFLPRTGYLSDPDVLFDAGDGRLWMYYRQVVGDANVILLSQSEDGIGWSASEEVLRAHSHEIVSPAVVRGSPVAPWAMLSVNSGPDGCTAHGTTVELRTSDDGRHWSAPVATDLAEPGQVAWHIDVQWVPVRREYWALYNTYPEGGTCATDALRFARSPDGLHWATSPSPVLRRGVSDPFRDVVYRSTFVVDPAGVYVTFWFSGASYASGKYVWRAATETRRVSDLLQAVAQPALEFLVTDGVDLPPPESADMPVRKRRD